MRTLIILAGLPGTGKSTYAKSTFPSDTPIVSSDEERIKITKSYAIMVDDMNIVYNAVIDRINEIFEENEDITVILDSTCLTDSRRNLFLDGIKKKDRVELHMLKVKDIETVLKRNKSRIKDKWVPEDVILGMAKAYSRPSKENESRYDEIKEIYVD